MSRVTYLEVLREKSIISYQRCLFFGFRAQDLKCYDLSLSLISPPSHSVCFCLFVSLLCSHCLGTFELACLLYHNQRGKKNNVLPLLKKACDMIDLGHRTVFSKNPVPGSMSESSSPCWYKKYFQLCE